MGFQGSPDQKACYFWGEVPWRVGRLTKNPRGRVTKQMKQILEPIDLPTSTSPDVLWHFWPIGEGNSKSEYLPGHVFKVHLKMRRNDMMWIIVWNVECEEICFICFTGLVRIWICCDLVGLFHHSWNQFANKRWKTRTHHEQSNFILNLHSGKRT